MNYFNPEDTICAITTGGGMSAIAVIRISGKHSISICNKIFSKDISKSKSQSIHFGTIQQNKKIIDEVLLSIFKDGKSFTGEESVEISCHGSVYIQNKIIQILIEQGCRLATAGEFSMRAFKNGKLDLSQAESIADLIESESAAAHQTAMHQLRGGFSNKLQELRTQLIDFASLIELELDFAEEDVEFADRGKFLELLSEIKIALSKLIESFSLGNVIKNGIPVAILGAPNVGKSTLLNCLLNEDKAIVSDIAGTTRDAIEDSLIIEGFNFRFIDTAGIRNTTDTIENMGIKKSFDKANQSKIILFLLDVTQNIEDQILESEKIKKTYSEKVLIVVNKTDITKDFTLNENSISISAKSGVGIEDLKKTLLNFVNTSAISDNESIVTNLRHFEELQLTLNEIEEVINGMESGISGDFLSINIRQALFHLGSITGEVTTDTLLGNIFGKFCIGK
ncbi:MAG: tRNA uridine-5-carboxymethylaminomethyl(34) synthesis GTPase MnmE [Flavobacteriales bacterium]|nr:tRNA uridine-5-carboxymethylaminomethyl(34) synthesis GTPase MnmE [Flavobacteriales bacterium]MBT7480949.1 tRNA uridine-5-carboxymethylaminomethyl(34) synthesis GTPase MnmE [Flavobacteriales bacterium]